METIRRILAPLDFSDHTPPILSALWSMAQAYQAEAHLLHVLPDPPYAFTQPNSQPTAVRHAREELNRLMPMAGESEQKCIRSVEVGNPWERIIAYAEHHEIDLIILGTKGRSGVSRALLGSVADRVIRNSQCPVMTVKPHLERTQHSVHGGSEEVRFQSAPLPPGLELIQRGGAMRATDVHVSPGLGDEYSVRFRIDGQLLDYCTIDRDVAGHLIAQLKTMSDLPIAEPFHPLEGRVRLSKEFDDLEARLTTAPVAGGEAAALRLFDRSHVFRPLEELGLTDTDLDRTREMCRRGEGIVLVTGPTNAGKTTTVYSMLQAVANRHGNIVSIEDPVELPAPFVQQMQVDLTHGITMQTGLRTILRMDPDVVFVGEIRDADTAEMAMRAASSGRYVFSTLHTRDVAATITALRDFGVDKRSLAANLTGIINQRLVRRVCDACSVRRPPSESEQERFMRFGLDSAPEIVVEAEGCDTCRGTGFRGRIGVFETVIADGELRAAISEGLPEAELTKLIRAKDTPSISMDALGKAVDLATTPSEAMELRWL